MSYINHDDVVAQLTAAGLLLDKPLTFDNRFQRWKVDGSDLERRGWSRLKEWTSAKGNIYIVGVFGVWQGNDDGKMKIELPKRDEPDRPALTEADIKAMRAAQAEAAKRVAEERKAEAKRAAQWAALVWSRCEPGTGDEYLTRKRIGAHGTRVMGDLADLVLPGIDDQNFLRLKKAAGARVVPMHDEHGNVCGIQFIYPAGHPRKAEIERDKEFWPRGMAMGGTFGLIGHVRRDGIILIVEGFATAASLYEATGQTVAYAFSANNLGKAGKLLRKTCPRARLLFCADDDYLQKCRECKKPTLVANPFCAHCGKEHGQTNPGCTAAAQATAEIENSAWLKPDFSGADGAVLRDGQKLTDFNDLAILHGVPLPLANQVNAKLDALKWRDAVAARGAINQGAGEIANGRRRAVSVMSLDEVVERFIFIDEGTGDFVFDTWTREVCKHNKMIKLLPAGVRGDDIKRHPTYIERAVYIDQIGFDPGEEDSNILCNRWTGWPTQPRAGKCDVLLDLLRYLCSTEDNHEELFQWVLRWLAYPLQHPGAKMHSAIVVHGPQGTGKSRFFEAYAKIFGDFSTILTQGTIEDKFNADWSERRLFVIADEIVANTEKYHLKNQLKNFITSDWVRINPKNVAAHRERNHMNMVFLSNEIQPVVLENDDRRHCVIYTPKKLRDEFYAEATEEIADGGIEALHQYLLDLKLGDFKPWTRPPMTDAKRRLILVGAGSEEQYINDWIDGALDIPFCPVSKATLYAEYLAYCRREGDSRPRPAKYFWAHVERLGYFVGIKDRLENLNKVDTVSWRCCIPSDEVMEKAGRQRGGGYGDLRKKPGETQAEWLCNCYWAVDLALSKRRQEVRDAA